MIKVAMVGLGFMGRTHIINIDKITELQLVAIVDKNIETIEKTLAAGSGNFSTGNIDPSVFKNTHKYSDFDECLQSEELDAVNICVHTDLHYEMAKKALMNNKHVFIEKPFTLNIQHAEELIGLAKQKGKILMVGHVVRFMPPYQKLKEWIDSNEFGQLKFLYLSRFSGTPAWGQWKEKQLNFGSSGGALFDLTIHDIDFASYVLGPPKSIKCDYMAGALSKHDYISALWDYPDKKLNVKIEGGNTFHSNFPFQAGYMAQFEKASILYTSFFSDFIQVATDTHLRQVPAGDSGKGYFNEIEYFAQCITNNIQPAECMPESSLQTIQLCYKHLEK